MKAFILRSIVLCILINSFAVLQISAGSIVYPWRAVKAIVQQGNHCNILFNNINSSSIDSVILEGPFNRVILQIDSVITGRSEFDIFTHASVNNKIWAAVPAGTPEELYNLIIKSGGETNLSNKSVKVVQEFREEHSFIHITDLHMTRQWVGTPEAGYAKELELYCQAMERPVWFAGVESGILMSNWGIFRIFRINGSSFKSTPPLRFTKDPTLPYQKIELNLTLNYDKPNNGTSTGNAAVIANNLGVELPSCHIRFIMKKGRYKVNNGLIYQVIESGKFSVVDVRIDVSSEGPTEVRIVKI